MNQNPKILINKYLCAVIFFLLAIAGSLYFSAINSDKFGFYHDDGIYLVTAKAIATGHGYRILSLPDEPFQTKYPPVFPLALSALWRANPDFPANLPLFSLLSVVSTLVFFALTASFFLKNSYANKIPVLVILLFSAFNWRVLILATSILSEALFALMSLCVLWLASSLGRRRVLAKGLALGILAALATLTRLAGISLLAAVLVYALTRRQVRRFLLPIVLASSIIAGWFIWCHLHQSSAIGSNIAYYTNYLQDWHSLIQSSDTGAQKSLMSSVLMMVGKNLVTLLSTIPVVCLGIPIHWLQGISQARQFPVILIGLFSLILLIIGFYKTRFAAGGLLHYYILAYLALLLLWPYTIYDRFLTPILPFLLLFIVSGGIHIFQDLLKDRQIRKWWTNAAGFCVSCIILGSLFIVACFALTSGLGDQFKNSKMAYAAEAQQKQELSEWLKTNSRKEDVLVCYQDPVYFLYTGIKSIRLPPPRRHEAPVSYADRLQKFLRENKATLLIQTENDFSLESYSADKRTLLAQVLKGRSKYLTPVFFSRAGKSTVYRILTGSKFNAK